jgi:predicted DNA binding CopG/RHH family protein
MKEKLDPPRQLWETVEYTDNPELPDIEYLKEVKNFLPKPEDLVFKEAETEKVTMVFDKEALEFFRAEAQKLGASYQRMIRNLVNEYVARHKKDDQNLST